MSTKSTRPTTKVSELPLEVVQQALQAGLVVSAFSTGGDRIDLYHEISEESDPYLVLAVSGFFPFTKLRDAWSFFQQLVVV